MEGSQRVAFEAGLNLLQGLEEQGEQIALILLGGVNYYTGQYLNLKEITKLGQSYGIMVGFDLAHAAGNVDMQLHEWNVDFAAWCSYKYLNSGPGSLAAVFIHNKHGQDLTVPRLSGWWGHNKDTRFRMRDEFDPLPGAEGWQLSNPPILPLAAMRASMEIFDETSMQVLRNKSERLTGYLEFLLRELASEICSIITPTQPEERGSQLSIRLKDSLTANTQELLQKLIKRGVICDFREPNIIRVAPTALYNRYSDVYDFVHILKEIST